MQWLQSFFVVVDEILAVCASTRIELSDDFDSLACRRLIIATMQPMKNKESTTALMIFP